MNKIRMLLIFALLIALTPAFSQPGPGRNRNAFGADLFQIRFFRSFIPEKKPEASVDSYIQMANDVLTFIKTDSTSWRARFEVELLIYDARGDLAAYRTLRDTITVGRFELTNARGISWTQAFRFYLKPGGYTWRLKLLNAEGIALLEREERLEVAELNPDRLQISDIILADSLDCETGLYAPNLRGAFRRQNSAIGVIFELYPPAGSDSVRVWLTLMDAARREMVSKSLVRPAASILRYCIDLADEITRPGDYTVQLSARSGSRLIQAAQRVLVLWGQAEVQQESLDLAVEQLALIARGSTIREMERAQGALRDSLYEAFWQKRDPTPETPLNELREEFFRRIDHSNRSFSESFSGRQGWRTDRGRVYIQNGPPDQIEKHAGEMGMASTEIWAYNRLNRRYLFVDRLSNGEFRLAKTE
ncbi:MAG TPA: GWxTD domain-containing protein [bacterium]|nr:GWxTD domain-containing protein [bacterium]HOC24147.1 GWxTD domain-containing protein [bacterium]HOH06959.1 GWxTD domain-containing protein [bacterium]